MALTPPYELRLPSLLLQRPELISYEAPCPLSPLSYAPWSCHWARSLFGR